MVKFVDSIGKAFTGIAGTSVARLKLLDVLGNGLLFTLLNGFTILILSILYPKGEANILFMLLEPMIDRPESGERPRRADAGGNFPLPKRALAMSGFIIKLPDTEELKDLFGDGRGIFGTKRFTLSTTLDFVQLKFGVSGVLNGLHILRFSPFSKVLAAPGHTRSLIKLHNIPSL